MLAVTAEFRWRRHESAAEFLAARDFHAQQFGAASLVDSARRLLHSPAWCKQPLLASGQQLQLSRKLDSRISAIVDWRSH